MALSTKLELRQGQQLVMTPQLQQAIKLLQLSRLELVDIVQQELLENPVLEDTTQLASDVPIEEAEARAAADETQEVKGEEGANEIDWDRYLREGFEMGASAAGEREELPQRDEAPGRVPVVKVTLQDRLMSQLRMVIDKDEDIKIGEFIIGNLDPNGFLDMSSAEIADLLSVDEDRVERVLDKISKKKGRNLDEVNIRKADFGDYKNEIKRIRELYNDLWDTERHPQQVRLTDAEFNYLAMGIKAVSMEDLIFIIEKNGKSIGLSVNLPDIN